MDQHHMTGGGDHYAWWSVFITWTFWLIGHVTLSNIALVVSICVGLLQAYKTIRDIRKDKP